MNLDRRTFLKSSAALAAALPFADLAAVPAAAQTRRSPQQKRPGLFFDASDLPRIRKNLESPRFAVIRNQLFGIDHAAERKFLSKELRLNDHVTDFARMRSTLEHASLAYALRSDPESLETAKLALSRLLEYRRWDYFLEGGKDTIGLQRAPEGTIAACCALDWLGDALSAETIAETERQIATKGAPACYLTLYGMKYPDRVRGWSFNPEQSIPLTIDFRRWPLILNATNLKIIPTAALGIAATWLHGRHPQAAKWLELSRQSAQAFSVMYGSDGSYDEGVGYWGYTTMHLAMLADVLHRHLGIDDRKLINYPGSIRYALCMAMPTAGEIITPDETKVYNAVPKGSIDPKLDLVNFCDGGIAIDVSVASWVARTAKDPLSQYVAENTGVLKHYHAAFWLDPKARSAPPEKSLHDVRMSNDWVVSRTGWAVEDSVLALRSGGPANHEHADRNSLIFKAHGERLFNDPFKAAYVPTNPRWVLRLTEGHTALLIGGRGHQYHDGSEGTNASWAWARILAYRTVPGGMVVTSDATEAYALLIPTVKRVLRTVVFLKPEVVIVLDQVDLSRAEAVQTRYQVFNEDGRGGAVLIKGPAPASGTQTGFRITRPRATLEARSLALAPLAATVGKLPIPEPDGVFPFVELTSPSATTHAIATVATAAPGGESHGALTVTRSGAAWTVSGTHRGRTIAARLTLADDALPAIDIG